MQFWKNYCSKKKIIHLQFFANLIASHIKKKYKKDFIFVEPVKFGNQN